MQKTREYVRVLLVLTVVLGLYRLLAVPLLEPPAPPASPIEEVVHRQPEDDPWWSRYFAQGAWQTKEPTVIQTEEGVLLFQDWQQITPERLKLWPLTIVIPRNKKSGLADAANEGSVIFIENPEGAEIQFREAIDLSSGRPPPVVGGHLRGAIQIISPASKSDGSDELFIQTKNVHIDRRHLWTPSAVHLKLGTSVVEGQDLSVVLDKDLLSQSETKTPVQSVFRGLDHIELRYVDRVHIDLPHGGLWKKKAKANQKNDAFVLTDDPSDKIPDKPIPATMDVRCGGAFYFDFHSGWAKMLNSVDVTHQIVGQPLDRFQCYDLEMHFSSAEPEVTDIQSTDPSGLPEGDREALSTWTIDQIRAFGKPSGDPNLPEWWVRLESPGMQTNAIARRLEIDLNRGGISVSNQLQASSPIDSTRVYLQYEGLRVWSPNIAIENEAWRTGANRKSSGRNSSNQADQSAHLGALDAAGPGSAQLMAEDGDEWKLSWASQLKIVPEGNEDHLIIAGNANASSVRQGRFSAEKLDAWLFSVPDQTLEKLRKLEPNRHHSKVLPDRFHAQGQVIVESAQLHAQVEDMKVWLVYPLLSRIDSMAPANANELAIAPRATQPDGFLSHSRLPSNSAPLNHSSPLGRLASSTGNSSTNRLDDTFAPPALVHSDPRQPRENLESPIHVTGPNLRAKIIVEATRNTIDDMELDGGVTVTRDHVTETSPEPLTITGDRLKLNTSENGMADVQMVGSPARVKVGSGSLEGPEVRFNQRDQRVWIDHPGEFVVPVESIAKPSARSEGVQWQSSPRIQWAGGMIFDGQVANLSGGVALDGDFISNGESRWVVQGNAESMQVILTAPIGLNGDRKQASDLERIILEDQVDIRATQLDSKGQRISLERIAVPKLTINMLEQTLVGQGAGWVRSRRFGKSLGSSPLTKSADTKLGQAKKEELFCMHLTFAGAMHGSFKSYELRFQDRVECLLGPIRTWEDSLDVNQLRRLSLGQSLLTCDLLEIVNTAGLSSSRSSALDNKSSSNAWELDAQGHVKIDSVMESGLLNVLATQAQFVGLQDLLRIKGTMNSPAEVHMQPTDAQTSPLHVLVTYLDLNVETMASGNMQLIRGGTGPAIPQGFGGAVQGPASNSPAPPASIPSPRVFPPR